MSEEILIDTGWVKLKKTKHGFIFAERKGVNSTATLLFRFKEGCDLDEVQEDDVEILIRNQPMPLNNEDDMELYACPITGGLEEDETPKKNAVKEVLEEAGYKIEESDLHGFGRYLVGTQTNETVHMFVVDVTGKEPEEIKGDGSYFEGVSNNEWCSISCGRNAEYSGLVILANKLFNYMEDFVGYAQADECENYE